MTRAELLTPLAAKGKDNLTGNREGTYVLHDELKQVFYIVGIRASFVGNTIYFISGQMGPNGLSGKSARDLRRHYKWFGPFNSTLDAQIFKTQYPTAI